MKKWLYFFAFFILFSACQKVIEPFDDSDSVQNNTSINGTWNFVSLEGHTQTTLEYTEADTNYKSVSYSDYISTDSTGTITFDSTTFNSAAIGYNVNSIINEYNYQNDVLVDSSQMPFSIIVSNSNSTGNYQLIGSDSIYFPAGSFVAADGTTTTQPSGGKINVNGNKLTIIQMINKDTTQITGLVPYRLIKTGTFVSVLQKK